ncbi:hypothetical protein N0V87_000426 [Didymella glomerata]|uniref:F-box domain-containing protein n=1 Tax=Didymella glomerata TaxID=749621 RepID=A0A9W9C4J7_9PLEO|nr:hypothetical protein N0V87_000426 [Didymella glomerata]
MAVRPSSNLLHLPLVIIRILAEELYETDRKAFSNFRLVCKSCSNASEYLLFRTVVIDHGTKLGSTQFTTLADRLKDGNDTIRGHVRHLRIGPFEDEDNFDPKLWSVVHDFLRSINRLQTLTWNMSCMPLPAMLTLFNEKHSSARLYVTLRNRKFLEHDALFSNQESCDLRTFAPSWGQLQRLDLQGCRPHQLFASLTNHVPNLKYLKFYLSAGGGFSNSDLPVLAAFIGSTPVLHTLDFGAEYIETLTEILRVILQNLHGSLRSLKISHTMPDYSGPIDFRPGMLYWEPEHYLEVLDLTPGLEHFDAQIAGQTLSGNWEGEKARADAEKKWKSAKKNGIKGLKKSMKSQRSRRTQRSVW